MGILASFSIYIVRRSFHQFLKMTVPADKEETHRDTHTTLRSLILSDYIAKQSTSAEKIYFFLRAAFICEKPILLHISETRMPPSGHF